MILKEKLEIDVKKLKDQAKIAQDNYKRGSTECKKRQEANIEQQKALREEIGEDRVWSQNRIEEAKIEGQREIEQLKAEHEATMAKLQKECNKQTKALNEIKSAAEKEERELEK